MLYDEINKNPTTLSNRPETILKGVFNLLITCLASGSAVFNSCDAGVFHGRASSSKIAAAKRRIIQRSRSTNAPALQARTIVVTLANQNNPLMQSKLKATTCSCYEEREILNEQVTIGFGFTSEWLRKWREFIVSQSLKRSNAQQNKRELLSTVQ